MFENQTPQMETTTTEAAPESTGQADVGSTDLAPGEASSPEHVDLDKVNEFMLDGQKMTKDQLMSAMMRQADYTRKTQAFSQERKFYDNLSYDIANVLKNPSLVDQFKKIYPAKFHKYLGAYEDYIQTKKDPDGKQVGADPQLVGRINQIESRFRQQEVKAAEAALDGIFQKYSTKYPYAEEASVVSRAIAVMEYKRGQGEPEDLTNTEWDSLFKGENDRVHKLAETKYKEQVGKQLKANQRGRDSASGGGLAGQSPARLTMKEATAAAIRDLGGKQN